MFDCCCLGSIGILGGRRCVFFPIGLVSGCLAIKVDAIYAGWGNSIARLVVPLAEFVVPAGESSMVALVMVECRDLETSGAEVFCLFVREAVS